MEQQQSSSSTATRYRERKPLLYNVVMHNDDFTTMDFVVMVLISIFDKSSDEAVQIMLHIHENGEAIVGSYIYDIAHSKCDKATSMARENGFPLQITVENKL